MSAQKGTDTQVGRAPGMCISSWVTECRIWLPCRTVEGKESVSVAEMHVRGHVY